MELQHCSALSACIFSYCVVLKESISLTMAFINIHCNNDIMLPLGSVLQNPSWKTSAVLKIFRNHSQKFKTAELPLVLPIPLLLTLFPNFRFLSSRKPLVFTYILISHGAFLCLYSLCMYMKKNLYYKV